MKHKIEEHQHQGAFKLVKKETLEYSPYYITRANQTIQQRIEEEMALLVENLHPIVDLQKAFNETGGEGLYVIVVDYFYPEKESPASFYSKIQKKYEQDKGLKLNPYKKLIK